jgi:hypothetical protein
VHALVADAKSPPSTAPSVSSSVVVSMRSCKRYG